MSIKIGDHEIKLSNLDKPFFPPHLNKGHIVDYYNRIAPIMLPHIKDRPLMLHRFPDGITGEAFYQKNSPDYFPRWIKRHHVPLKANGTTEFTVCQNRATLVYLANQAVIAFHAWLSRIDNLTKPDRLIFDLDPSTDDFSLVIETAQELRELLTHYGLKPFVMTTGSRGLHVIVPLKRYHTFDQSRRCAEYIAKQLIKKYPDQLTLELRKEKRRKRLFLDILRNQFGATSIAPYSVRARPKAPVAAPLFWDELNNKKLTPQQYTIKNIFDRLERISDPFAALEKNRSSLTGLFKKANL